MSYRTLQGDVFEVRGGAVEGARRLQQGSNQRWEITVEPDSDGAEHAGDGGADDQRDGAGGRDADGVGVGHFRRQRAGQRQLHGRRR